MNQMPLNEMGKGNSPARFVTRELGWDLGVAWMLDENSGTLRFTHAYRRADRDLEEFENICREQRFARGEGLPGRVWETGEPAWITDVTRAGR